MPLKSMEGQVRFVSDVVDRLEVKVEAEAQGANKQLDKLVGNLEKVSSSLGAINAGGLQGLANGVQKLSNSMLGMKNVKTTDFTSLTKNIGKLGAINTTGLNSAASSMIIMGKSLSGLGKVSENAVQLGELSKSISKLGNKGVANAITNIPQLADALNKMMGTLSRSPQVSKNLIQMTNSLANLASQGSKVSSATKSINSSFKSYSSATDRATKSSKSFASAVGMLYARFWMLKRAAQAMFKSVESSMDFLETVNYFEVAVGKIGKDSAGLWQENGYNSAEEYANSFSGRLKELTSKMTGFEIDVDGNATMSNADSLGLNPDIVMQNQAVYAQMADSLGLVGETAINTSKAFTMLGADWASLRNISLDTAWEKFASAMAGQSRAVRSLGIDITMATLQETAYKYGLTQAVQEMNQATKAQLRLLTIMNQSTVAFGDMANTIQSPANQLRILQQNFANLSRIIGNLFLPVIAKVLPYINGLVIAMQRLFTWVGGLLGIKFDSINSAIGGAGDGIGDVVGGVGDLEEGLEDANAAAKKLKTTTLGIDELNINAPQEDSGGKDTPVGGGNPILDGAIADALAEYEKVWNDAFNRMDNKAKEIADNIAAYFGKIWDAAENTRIALKNLWNDGLKDLANFSIGTLKDFYTEFLVPIGKWTLGTGLPRFLNITNSMLKDINWGKLRTSLKSFYEELTKFTKFVFTGVLDFYEYFLKPIAVWTMNKALPLLVDTITNLSKKINWDSLNSMFSEFYKVLSKFAVGIGQGMLNFFELLAGVLTPIIATSINIVSVGLEAMFKVFNMIPDNVIEGIGFALAGLLTTLKAYAVFQSISVMIAGGFAAIKSAIETFALTIMCYPWAALAVAVAAAIGIVIASVREADEIKTQNMGNAIKNALTNPGGVPLEDIKNQFCDSMEEMGGGFSVMSEKSQELDNVNKNIKDVWLEIEGIEIAMNNGVLSVEEGKQKLETLFGELATLTEAKFQAIETSLVSMYGENGVLSSAMDRAGHSTKDALDSAVVTMYNSSERAKEIATEMQGVDPTSPHYKELRDELVLLSGEVDSFSKAANDYAYNISNLSVNYGSLVDEDGKLEQSQLDEFLSTTTTAVKDYNTNLDEAGKEASIYWKQLYDAAIKEDDYDSAKLYKEEMENIPKAIEILKGDAITKATELTDGMQTYFVGGIKKVVEGLKTEWEAMPNPTQSMDSFINEGLGQYMTNTIDPLSKGIETSISTLGVDGAGWASGASQKIIDSLFDITLVETSSYAAYGNSATVLLKNNWESIIIDSTKGLGEKAKSVGKDISDGAVAGVDKDALTIPIAEMGKEGIGSLQETNDSHSPSLVYKALGKDMVDGLNLGITENVESTVLAIDAWATQVIERLNTFFGENFTPTFFETAFSTAVWTEKLNIWFESISPFFTLEKWELLLSNTVLSFTNTWDKISKDTLKQLELMGINISKSIDLQNKTLDIGMQLRLKNWGLSWDNMNSITTKICSEIQKTVKLMSDGVKNECDNVISKLDEVSRKIASIGSGTAKVGVSFSVPQFAGGGFPNTGELFMARENGITEMVGSMGSRASVANNDQIVEGIASGVAYANEGVIAELRQQNALLRELIAKDSVIEMDSREVGKILDSRRNRNGLNFSPA